MCIRDRIQRAGQLGDAFLVELVQTIVQLACAVIQLTCTGVQGVHAVIQGLGAVSYTHLDVYKRQVHGR